MLRGLFKIGKEIARHVLRRPVVGIAAVARTPDGRYVLVRRSDTGQWALPGGTLEWGETLRAAIERELYEEAGVRVLELGALAGVYSEPDRDARFHAVTVVVCAQVSAPERPPQNHMEIREVGVLHESELPIELSYRMGDMLGNARAGGSHWE
jgi:8-oxo-dGTP diphosphatase